MNDFYTTWSIFDTERDESVVLYRCIICASSLVDAQTQARAYAEHAVQQYRDRDDSNGFYTVGAEHVEISVMLLVEYYGNLVVGWSALRNVQLDEPADDGKDDT